MLGYEEDGIKFELAQWESFIKATWLIVKDSEWDKGSKNRK